MARLIWSPSAVADLDSICEFVAQDSPEFARLTARRVVAAAESAARFPLSGRIVPEFHDVKLREKIIGNYRLIYRLKTGAIEVAAVMHGARRLEADNF